MFDLVSKSPLQLNTTCKENMKKRFLMCNFTLKLTGIFKCPHWNNWFFNTSHEVPHSIGKYWKISKKTSARNFFFISEYVNRLFTVYWVLCCSFPGVFLTFGIVQDTSGTTACCTCILFRKLSSNITSWKRERRKRQKCLRLDNQNSKTAKLPQASFEASNY